MSDAASCGNVRLDITILLVVGVQVLSVASAAWLPLGDYYGHLELMDVVARYDDPATLYREVYTLPIGSEPNTLPLLIAWLLGGSIDTLVLGRALIVAYVAALPLALLVLARAFGRSPWCGVLGAPLAFSAVLNVGFLGYLLALPLLLVTLALARRHALRPRLRSGLVLAALVVLLFFAHVIALLMGVAMAGALIALHARSWRRAIAGLWPIATCAPLVIHWSIQMFVTREASGAGRALVAEDGLELVFDPLLGRLGELHGWGMQFSRGIEDEIGFAALAVIWVAWLFMGRRAHRGPALRVSPNPNPDGRLRLIERARAYDLELLTACCFAAYLLLPSHMHEMSVLHQRVSIVVLLLLAAWPRLRPAASRAAAVAVGAAVVLSLVYPVVMAAVWHRFSREEVRGMPAMVERLPERSRLTYVKLDLWSSTVHMGPLWYMPNAIHAARNGGVADESFASRPYTPVQYREGQVPVRISTMGALAPRSPHLSDRDYVLVLSRAPPVGFLDSDLLRLIESDGSWWLFEVTGTDRDGFHIRAGGDAGGSLRVSTCAEGSHLAGLEVGVAHERIASLAGICAADASTDPSAEAVEETIGAASAPTQALRCAGDGRVVGLRGSVTRGVRRVELVCEPDAVDGARSVRASDDPTARGLALLCPAGTVARRLRLRAGAWIDALGIGCR